MNDPVVQGSKNARGMASAVYILYLVSLVFGITSLIGVVMAYISRSDAPEWLASHYRLQIRTFWIGMLYGIIGMILVYVVIGWLVLLFTLVWFVVRCVKGLKYLNDGKPYPNPAGWMF